MGKYIEVSKSQVRNLNDLTRYEFDSRYVANNKGEVFLIKSETPTKYICLQMSPFKTRDGYVEYVLTTPSGSKKHMLGHRITAGLYLKDVVGKDHVNHIDGDRANNDISNLEYVTRSENLKHSYEKLGRTPWNKKL